MKLLSSQAIETCFDGSLIKEITFDSPTTEDFILYLGQKGQLSYFKTFARPFYKVVFPTAFYLKGVEGNFSARAHLWTNEDEILLQQFIDNFPN
jgi:hypothetical protein